MLKTTTMASTKDVVLVDITAEDTRTFLEIETKVMSHHCNYDDIRKLLGIAISLPDEVENFEVTGLLCDVLDSKIPVPTNFNDELKLNSCDWFGTIIPVLVSSNKWKRSLALKLINSLRKLIGNIELSQHEQWESLRTILMRHTDVIMQIVSDNDKHWLEVWMVFIDLMGNKLAHNTNRSLLNKLFKVLAPFKEDFRIHPSLQQVVRGEAFQMATVTCWQKVVDFWLNGAADVPLNHVLTIVRFFKKSDSAAAVVRAKCVLLWRVVCKLPPNHKGIQPSIEQLFVMLLDQNASKTMIPSSGSSTVELVADLLSEMLALVLGAHLRSDNELVFNEDLLLPKQELISSNSTFLLLILQCYEKLLLIDPVLSTVKPNVVAIKAGFHCFVSKINSNSSAELINCVLKLPQNIFSQAPEKSEILNNCIDILIKSVVSGPHCFGENVMISSKYYSGATDLMTGSPTLMFTQLLLDKTKLALFNTDVVLSILESLITKGIKTIHYVHKIMSLLKSLGKDESVKYLTVLKVWQTVVLSINNHYRNAGDFTRETPDLGWVYSVILFPLNCFNDQYCREIANYMGSKHQSALHFTLLTNNTIAGDMNASTVCETLASKLNKLLSVENPSNAAAIAVAMRVLATAAPLSKFPCGKRNLSATFKLVANVFKAVKTLTCETEPVVLELIKTLDALSVCLDGNLPTLTAVTPLVVSLLALPTRNKPMTDLILKTTLLYIEKVEKEYGKNSAASLSKIKAAQQLFEGAVKVEEIQLNVLTPKRFPTHNAANSPTIVRRITPKRVLAPTSANAFGSEQVVPAETPPKEPKKSAKKLYTRASAAAAPAAAAVPAAAAAPAAAAPAPLRKPAAPSAARVRGPLTKHQKEKMRERQDNIPALYTDLTQESQAVADSQAEFTQDSSTLVIPQRFKAAGTTEGTPEVESRPFASVVQTPEPVKVDKGVVKEKTKAIYDIFKKDKKATLLPIHLKKVHPPRETMPLDGIEKPQFEEEKSDRPFQAFSPANKKKRELSQLAALGTGKATTITPQKGSTAESDFSQDIIADSQRVEHCFGSDKDDCVALFPTELNFPIRVPSQRKTVKRQTLDSLWENDFKKKSMKRRSLSNAFADSESDQSICEKNLDIPTKGIAKLTALPENLMDDSSNTSTDSVNSGKPRKKNLELKRLKMNLVFNENPLPVKRPRRSGKLNSNLESSSDAKEENPCKSGQSKKSLSQNNSDCDSVTSDISSASDIPSSKNIFHTRRARSICIPVKEDLLHEVKSLKRSVCENLPQPLETTTSGKRKTKSIGAKESVTESALPTVEKLGPKENLLQGVVVELENLCPTEVEILRKSMKNKAGTCQASENSISSVMAEITPKENGNQKPLAEENLQLSSSTEAMLLQTLALQSHSSIQEVCAVIPVPLGIEPLAPKIGSAEELLPSLAVEECLTSHVVEKNLEDCVVIPVPLAIEQLVPEIDSTEEVLPLFAVDKDLPSLAVEQRPSSNSAVPTHEETSKTSEEQSVMDTIHPIILDSDRVARGNGKEVGEDFLLANKSARDSESNVLKSDSGSANLILGKENKIVEESQDSIVPCSQLELGTNAKKLFAAKRKQYRPRILTRSSVAADFITEVLSSVSVIPETQILDTQLESEDIRSKSQEPVADATLSSKPSSLEPQSVGNALAPAEILTPLATEEVQTGLSNETLVHILLPANTQAQESLDSCSDDVFSTDVAVESLEVVSQEETEGTSTPTNALSEHAAVPGVASSETASGEGLISPPRFSPKVMENLSPSMLRLLFNSQAAQKYTESVPISRSKKMLKMICPGLGTGVKLKLQTGEQEPFIYVDQSFPAQECIVGEDGTPVLQDWKKCVPSPASVPSRSSLKCTLPKRESGKNRKLCFPFEPTTKVLYYYEKKNSKCMENISEKIKKRLKKRKRAEVEQVAENEKEVEGGQTGNTISDIEGGSMAASSAPLYTLPEVLPNKESLLPKSDLPAFNEYSSSIKDTLVPIDEPMPLLVLSEPKTTEEESATLSKGIIDLTDDIPSVLIPDNMPSANFSVISTCMPLQSESKTTNEELATASKMIVDLTDDIPLVSISDDKSLENFSMVSTDMQLQSESKTTNEESASASNIIVDLTDDIPLLSISDDIPLENFSMLSTDIPLQSESKSANEESTTFSNIIVDLTDDIPLVSISDDMPSTNFSVVSTISKMRISKTGKSEPDISDKCIDLASNASLLESPKMFRVASISPLLVGTELIAIPTPSEEPNVLPTKPVRRTSLFEDSFHDYIAPTPLSLPDPELLDRTEPLYADLVECQQPIAFMVPCLTTPQWQGDLSKELAERNIVTVGDFCRRTERQIDLLPIKGSHKVKTARRALDKYKTRLQIADAPAKDLLKGLECNKYCKDVFDQLYPCTKSPVVIASTQTCSDMEDTLNDSFVKNASPERLFDILQGSGKLADDTFVDKLVKSIEPSKYISMLCNTGSLDAMTLELANSINLLPSEARMRHINTLLSHLKFKD